MIRPRSRNVRMAILLSVSLMASGCVIGVLDVGDDDSLTQVEVFDHQFFSLELEEQSLLLVEAVNGNVRVRGASGVDLVTVNATRRVRARSHEKAEDHLYLLHIHLSRNQHSIVVETSQPASGEDVDYAVDYDIIVPFDLEVEVIQANGDVRIEDIGADVWVENGNGDVTLDDLVGSVWVAVGNGQVDTNLFLPYGKAVDQAVGNGSIKLRIQREVSAALSAQVGNGTISVSGLNLHNQVVGPTVLSGILGDGAGFIGLTVGNGWIQIEGK